MFLEKSKYDKVRVMANRLAGYYYSPVYLVGSVLTTQEYNDVDIVVVLSDENFERRYGSIKQYQLENEMPEGLIVRKKWAMDCYKRWEIISNFTGLNIDFKIQSKTIASQHKDKPYLRIDDMDCFN